MMPCSWPNGWPRYALIVIGLLRKLVKPRRAFSRRFGRVTVP